MPPATPFRAVFCVTGAGADPQRTRIKDSTTLEETAVAGECAVANRERPLVQDAAVDLGRVARELAVVDDERAEIFDGLRFNAPAYQARQVRAAIEAPAARGARGEGYWLSPWPPPSGIRRSARLT